MIEPHPLANKRILFALCGFDLGGAERQALYLAKYLKGVGVDVRVWGHHHEFHGPERVIVECEAAGIPWAEYKFRWPCGLTALIRDASQVLIGLHKVHPDAVLAYTTWPNIGCGLVWRWSPTKAFLWGQRDLAPTQDRWIVRKAFHGASTIICNAAHERNYLSRLLGKPSAPIHVVPNGIELDQPQWSRSQWREKLGLPEDGVLVTMLANLRKDKDFSTLLHAWSKIKNLSPINSKIHLCLAGAHQEGTDGIKTLLHSLYLEDSVLLPGQISDVSGFLSACDIGILSTLAEGLPNAILEYMTCGLPVVATDVPGNREALGEDSGKQFCKVKNAEDLADKLFSLISSPELRFRLGSRNRQRAITEFSIETMCSRMTEILVGTLKKKA